MRCISTPGASQNLVSLRGRWVRLPVTFAVVALTREATAQVTDDALRRDLVAQAEAARDANHHAQAFDLATRAAAIRVSPSLSLMLAQEGGEIGRVVEALDHARRCVSEAGADPALRNRDRILRLCETMVGELDRRVARVTVTMPAEGANGATVDLAGRSLPSSVWGIAVPVNPGDVTVQARTAEGRAFSRTLHLGRGERSEVVVAFAASEVSATPHIAPAITHTEPPARPRIDPPSAPVEPPRSIGAGPWVLAGAGALAFAAAGVTWAMHGGAISDRDAACDAGGCDPSAIDDNDRAQSLTAITNVSLALGGTLVASGAAWFIIAATRGSSTGHTAQAPHTLWPLASVTSQGALVGLGGAL